MSVYHYFSPRATTSCKRVMFDLSSHIIVVVDVSICPHIYTVGNCPLASQYTRTITRAVVACVCVYLCSTAHCHLSALKTDRCSAINYVQSHKKSPVGPNRKRTSRQLDGEGLIADNRMIMHGRSNHLLHTRRMYSSACFLGCCGFRWYHSNNTHLGIIDCFELCL